VTGADDQLVHAVDRLVDQVGHWAPAWWAQPSPAGGPSRAEVVHALAQRLADLEAAATGRPARPVPRLDNDLALLDQVRVMALDLVKAHEMADAGPGVLDVALDAVTRVRRQL
jgi:hypothetical protein